MPFRLFRRSPPPPPPVTHRRGLFGRGEPPAATGRGRRARKGHAKTAAGRAPARAVPGLPRTGRLDALGFFIAAGLILAWPRERSLLQAWREEGWRGLVPPPSGPPKHPAPHAADTAEPERGRAATHPGKIPIRGWKDIALRTWAEFNNDRIMATAAGVTFFTLLAMFPAMAAFVSLYGLFFDVNNAREQLSLLSGLLPRDAIRFVGDQMQSLTRSGDGKLGVAFVISLLLSLWSANGAVKAIIDGLNVAYGERERRGFVKLNLITLGFTAGALVFALLSIGAIVVAPTVMNFLHVDAGGWWLAALRWPVLLVVLALGLSAVYRFGPSRARPRWRWITVGGAVAAVLWVAASLLFSWYVQAFGNFNKTYGSLGAVVAFMTWLWYTTTIVLVGAELNAEIEHQTAVDTTTGPPRPMGERGARMADSLGTSKG